ncbi:hypothetical protein G9A89_002330 [Geosiphon pyriformis]|nr:hypothetical protein G9A89_002330 [Geosiphon pyriformis]
MTEPPQSGLHKPIIGDTLEFIKSVGSWSRAVAKQGDVIRADIRFLNGIQSDTVYHLCGAEALKAFYDEENVERGKIRSPFDAYMFNNSLNIVPKLNGEAHKVRKGIILQVIHSPESIDRFLQTVSALSDGLIEELRSKIVEETPSKILFNDFIRKFVARFTVRFLFSWEEDEEFIRKQFEVITDISSTPIDIPFTRFHDGIKIVKWFLEFSKARLKEHRQNPEDYKDTMKLLATAKPELTDEEVIIETQHLIFALNGISSVISGAIMLLSREENQGQFAKFLQEVQENLSFLKHVDKLSFTGKYIEQKLPYTRFVVQETLRFYPVVLLQIGNAVRDFTVKGYKIPKDSIVIAALWANGFDEKIYNNPMVFRPERYESEIKNTTSGYEWTSFGGGDPFKTHKCAAQPAVLDMCSYIVARLFAEFEFELIDKFQEFDLSSTFPRPKEELPILVRNRK